jgi:glycosyltransferase involved in cell wall biosynthesis
MLGIEVAMLTACRDRHYVFGLAMAIVSKGICVDLIGSDEIDSAELHATPNLHFLNFRGTEKNNANFAEKLWKLFVYYAKLIRYVARSEPKILHILWNGRFELFDRTILMLYYKVRRRQIVLTAHNVNQARRDSNDSWLNRITLKIQYRLCDHIFVHTQKMKCELCHDFNVAENVVTVIPYPVNNACPDTELTSGEAKRRLGLRNDERAILFLGRIKPYKGIEYLLEAFRVFLTDKHPNYRLIIAGEPDNKEYLHEIQRCVMNDFDAGQVILRMQFVHDDEVEVYP